MTIRRKTEKAVRDRAGVPVTLLYDETNDKTIMARGDANGQQSVVIDDTPPIDVNIATDAVGLATSAKQLLDGHNVTVDNASGGSAVNIQDGGNIITVDGGVDVDITAQSLANLQVGTVDLVTRNAQTELYGYNGTNWQPVRLDTVTRSIQTMSYPHHEIHGGSGWDLTEVVDIPADDVYDIQITTADVSPKHAHMTINFASEQEIEWWWYENVAINVAGTTLTQRNHRRPSGDAGSIVTLAGILNTSIANANSDTAIVGATQLAHGKVGSNTKKTEGGGGGESREEWILEADEDYSLRFFNLGTGGYVSYHIDWYEHTDKAV